MAGKICSRPSACILNFFYVTVPRLQQFCGKSGYVHIVLVLKGKVTNG
jgi:hypothetical protein